MGPSVTVLTAVRDGARYLPDTIASIRAQSYEDWEHIIVDDASTDETPDIVAAAALGDSRIRLIRRSAPGGPYAAANEGLEQAGGRYVVVIDSDDVASPNRIEDQTSFLQRNKGLRACGGAWRLVDESGRVIGEERSAPSRSSRVLSWALPVVSGIVHSTLCAEREALLEVGGYAELSISADYGMWLELARRNWLGLAPEVVVYYRTHASGISRDMEVLRTESLDILAGHMKVVTGEEWDADEIDALWSVGRWHAAKPKSGFAALDRWERAFRNDVDLSRSDQRELRRLAVRLRFRHVKWNHAGAAEVASGVFRWLLLWLEPRRRSRGLTEPPVSSSG